MDESVARWLERYADALGVERLGDEEFERVLGLAGAAARASQRVAAPASAWLAGRSGRSAAEALAAAEALVAELGEGA